MRILDERVVVLIDPGYEQNQNDVLLQLRFRQCENFLPPSECQIGSTQKQEQGNAVCLRFCLRSECLTDRNLRKDIQFSPWWRSGGIQCYCFCIRCNRRRKDIHVLSFININISSKHYHSKFMKIYLLHLSIPFYHSNSSFRMVGIGDNPGIMTRTMNQLFFLTQKN